MDCYERFKRKMQYNGNSLRQEKVNNTKTLLENVFADDPAIVDGVYFWELGIDSYEDKSEIVIRFYNRKLSNANGVTVKFQTLYDTPVDVGDIIYCSKSDEYYICTEAFNIDDIHFQGTFTLCNWILKWQNKKGDILEYPCYDINTTQYNSGERFNQQITIGSSQHMITLPCDENTIRLSNPQRFILDKNTDTPTTFIVTQNDNTSYNFGKKGLVKITLYEHPFNVETDRADLGICDYIEPDIIPDNTTDNVIAKILYDSLVIKSGGDSQVYTGKFYNNEIEVTDMAYIWDIVCDFKDELNISVSNNYVVISIDNDDYVDEEFKLILSNEDTTVQSSIVIKIDSLY